MLVQPVTLEGNRLRLEPLSVSHLKDLCAVGLERELWRWTTTQLRNSDDMQEYMNQMKNEK